MTIAQPPWLGPTAILLLCFCALLKGGLEERLAAGSLWLNSTLTQLLRDYTWPQVQLAGFVLDLLSLVLLTAIALTSRKFWPLAAAAFQLLMVLTHVAKMVDPNIGQWSYITANLIWTYLLMISLGVGVWNCWRAPPYAPSGAQSGPPPPTA